MLRIEWPHGIPISFILSLIILLLCLFAAIEWFDASNLSAFITYYPDLAYFVEFVLGVVLSHCCVAVGFGT
jgi:hypothetical protein